MKNNLDHKGFSHRTFMSDK